MKAVFNASRWFLYPLNSQRPKCGKVVFNT